MKRCLLGFDVSALDSSFKAHAARGIGRYVRELSSYLGDISNPRLSIQPFSYKDLLLPAAMERALAAVPLGRQTLRQQVVYPLQLSSGSFRSYDVLHFPAHMDAPSWSRKPFLLTVLDLIPLVLRDLYDIPGRSLRFRLARFLELRAIRAASLILAISESTAQDVTRILGIPPERIRVTPLGVDSSFQKVVSPADQERVLQTLGLQQSEPIILYVGGIDQRKNIAGLLRVFARAVAISRELGRPLPRLVIAGHIEEDRNYPELLQSIERLGIRERVVLPGFVPQVDLVPLYSVAGVFLFMSLYEGFGLPPLEAMAAGVPVVSSDRGALKEVLTGSPGYAVNPQDEKRIADLVIEVLMATEEKRLTLAEEGRRYAARYTWQKTGDLTVAAYEDYIRGAR